MKYILFNLVLAVAGLGMLSCTEEIERPDATQFLGFRNSGLTELDNQVTVTIEVPAEVNTVKSLYFGNLVDVPLTETQAGENTIKTGSIDISRDDLKSIQGPGTQAFVYFLVNGDDQNMSSTVVEMASALSTAAPETISRKDQDNTVSYSINPTIPLTEGNVQITYAVNPQTEGATFQPWPGEASISGGEIALNGSNFNVNDTVQFKVNVEANGYTAETTTSPIIVTPYTFNSYDSTALLNDTTAAVRTESSLLYLEDAQQIQTTPLTANVNGTTINYTAQTVLSQVDSVITVDVLYKDQNGEDSVVVERFTAQYLEVRYEDYSATHQAYDLGSASTVFYTDASADLILDSTSVQTAGDLTLISASDAIFNNNNVNEVKEYVATPPAEAVTIAGGSTFMPEPGAVYVFATDNGEGTVHGIVKFGDIESVITNGKESLQQRMTVLFGE